MPLQEMKQNSEDSLESMYRGEIHSGEGPSQFSENLGEQLFKITSFIFKI